MTLTQPSPSLDALAGIPFTHERVLITTGIRSGLVITVAVHSTRLGQALGGVLTPQVIGELNVLGVVGAANNQLASPEGAAELDARGILWAPDFVVTRPR
jgi:glutamate dehydrogenase/leucine dehydrogenase